MFGFPADPSRLDPETADFGFQADRSPLDATRQRMGEEPRRRVTALPRIALRRVLQLTASTIAFLPICGHGLTPGTQTSEYTTTSVAIPEEAGMVGQHLQGP